MSRREAKEGDSLSTGSGRLWQWSAVLALVGVLVGTTALVGGRGLLSRWLQQAAENGDVREVRKLLALGADLNGPFGRRDMPAVAHGALSGEPRVVEALLQAGANPDDGLGFAVIRCDVESVRLLLEKGADPNLFPERDTILVSAVEAFGNKRTPPEDASTMVVLLLEHGARTDVADDQGVPLLTAARKAGAPPGILWLLRQHGAR